MSERFLHELLQSCNIEKIKGERCSICLEDFDTLSRETGTIEVATCLPCHHIVGSACIATWLKDNNSCPICRREFFQAQPRPFLEHGIIDGQGDDRRDVREINEDCCLRLNLGMEIAMISGYLVRKLIELRLLVESHGHHCIIAVSIYMASHLTGDPRSPREIADITDVGADLDASHIRETYNDIYSHREHLADVHLLYLMEEVFDETGPFRWPAPGNEVTDDEIEHRQLLQTLKDRCAEACNELGLVAAGTELTTRIASKLFLADLMAILSLRELTAASIIMASQIICDDPCSTERIAEALHLRQSSVRTAYETAFAHRDILVEQPWLEIFGRGSTESLLRRLPLPRPLP